jgi:argonaute-like protein implicated in RNA metabolism and viral defense
MVVEVVTKEVETQVHTLPIRSLVIHRDGILWPTERTGVQKAIEDLKQAGILSPNAAHAMLEIPKSAPAPLRLYEVLRLGELQPVVNNPQVGTYYLLDNRNAYLCATGRAFWRPGTVKPVHVKYVEGTLPFERCLEDVYFLTALAWTRPEDCTKHPITIKLTDRRLGEDAETFDSDALEYSTTEGAVHE